MLKALCNLVVIGLPLEIILLTQSSKLHKIIAFPDVLCDAFSALPQSFLFSVNLLYINTSDSI